MKVRLVPPAAAYRETFLRALRELREEGLPWWLGPELADAERDFAGFVAGKLADATRTTGVPKTHLWAIADDGAFVGRISIHHALDDALRAEGGHIGYDTVPSYRGCGVATEMLRQALPVAHALGVNTVLLTCDETNAASIRVIERNGGALRETRSLGAHRPRKLYYEIALTQE